MLQLVLSLTLGLTALADADSDAHWPSWRGPDGTGVAPCDAPTKWSDEHGVRWKVAVPGRGFSTPIVWGERIFLTTAVPTRTEEGEKGEPHDLRVLCLARATGEVLWDRVATRATPHEGYHRQYGSYASASPTTDGEKLVVSFGSFGLYAYDLEGELLWSHDLGERLQMRREFGEGSAPVLAGNTVLQACFQEGPSFLLALDAKTGKTRWRVERDEPSGWATPLVTTFGGVQQVVTSATNHVACNELATGKELWRCAGLGLNAIPQPLRFGDDVLVMSGYRDANLMSIRLGGEGDLSGTDSVRWSQGRGLAYTASPVLFEGRYFTVGDRGFLSAFDAQTGEPAYLEERLPRGSSFKASPVCAGGKLYLADEEGNVHVVRAGPAPELLGTNTLLGASFIASPAVAEGELLLRSRTHLYCIGGAE